MRESVVEKYLHEQVEARGGTTRKMKGRINDCDRLVIWPIDSCVALMSACIFSYFGPAPPRP